MNSRRFVFAVLLFIVGALNSAQAQTLPCIGSQTPVVVGYATGSISLSYQLCPTAPDYSSFYWNGTMTYSNVSFDGSFSINGSMSIRLDFANNAISSVAFNGGPLTYMISGQQYTVTFNNLAYSLNSAFQVGAPTGSLTINNVVYPADTAYFAYLFH